MHDLYELPTFWFEVTLCGFDGSNDLTDARVLWVTAIAHSEELAKLLVELTLAGCTAEVTPLPRSWLQNSETLDYALPLQAPELRTFALNIEERTQC
jgi:hypothetical protein